jgi:hypothetical protein
MILTVNPEPCMSQVTANPELRGIVARGASMLPTRVVERAFKPLYGQPLNFVAFGKAVKKLDDWYQQRGILGQVSCCVGQAGCSSMFCAAAGGVLRQALLCGAVVHVGCMSVGSLLPCLGY